MKSRNINVKGGFSIVHGLFLYGQENLYKWVDRVGFSSSKHLTKFLLWEKTGKSFPKTTTAQRYELLKRLGQRVVLSPL
jgi:hypothetical protein